MGGDVVIMYFSYGSNMASVRLKKRVPSARPLAVATLPGHDLRFHKKSTDGSAKCDAYETGRNEHAVIGVIYEIPKAEKPALDKAEGVGYGYAEKLVTVRTEAGKEFEATTYYATAIDPSLRPYQWYKQHVLNGAAEHGLPESYFQLLKNVAAVADPDSVRHDQEMAIYVESRAP